MTAYLYCWTLRPGDAIAVELRVTAPSAIAARREVRRFLIDHHGDGWTVESVRRARVSEPLARRMPPLASGPHAG